MFQVAPLLDLIHELDLSISIFRRFSLFPTDARPEEMKEIFFQSPFSGDFLCFQIRCRVGIPYHPHLSISIFRRFSLFPEHVSEALELAINFQSPFSGDFLCFPTPQDMGNWITDHVLSISIFRRFSLFQSDVL